MALRNVTPEIHCLQVKLALNDILQRQANERLAYVKFYRERSDKFPAHYPAEFNAELEKNFADNLASLKHLRADRKSILLKLKAAEQRAGNPKELIWDYD